MDIFDLDLEEFKKEVEKIVDKYTPEELLEELKKCGYQPKEESEIDNNKLNKLKAKVDEIIEKISVDELVERIEQEED